MEDNKKTLMDELSEEIESKIEQIKNEGIQPESVDVLYKFVDIHKDIANEKYWKEKIMRYRGSYSGEYGNYGDESYGRRGVPGTGRGRYRGNESYGRRGVDAKYRGEDALDEMAYHYGNYMESNNYGAKEDSSYKMIECFKDFGFAISEELEPQDKQMLKKAMQEVMQELDK